MPALRAFALAALAPVISAAGGLRDDPSRGGMELVRVNTTLHEFAASTGGFLGGHFDRDDFESIAADHLVIWATDKQLALMDASGIRSSSHPDVGALNFEIEKSRNYTDTPGEVPAWDEYCGYECMTARLTEMQETCRFPFELVSIGSSVEGRQLWAAKVSGGMLR